MVAPKYDITKLEHMSYILKAVSHPLRIAIVDLLLQTEELTVTEIHTKLEISQPETSRQLAVLKNAKLIGCRKEANTRFYYLVDRSISKLLDCVENCPVEQN